MEAGLHMADLFNSIDMREARKPVGTSASRSSRWVISLAFTLLLLTGGIAAVRGDDSPPLDRLEADAVASAQWGVPVLDPQPLLTLIEAWLSTEFGLPVTGTPPRVELVPPAKMVWLRYHGLLPEGAKAGAQARLMRDTVAVYVDSERTIYLADGWTGLSHADESVLVHEMVHHMQNMAGMKYECAQEREKLAYAAQERWLGLVGHSLEQDFELDAFSLLFKTRCLF
jgi:hypothetical protein